MSRIAYSTRPDVRLYLGPDPSGETAQTAYGRLEPQRISSQYYPPSGYPPSGISLARSGYRTQPSTSIYTGPTYGT
jgi:hypothetical protein